MTRHAFVVAVLLLLARIGHAQQASNPHGPLALSCSTCHAPNGWKPARVSDTFKHAPSTFPLEGAHTRTSCTGCHKRLDFKEVSPKCASCHEDVHKGELGADCARCHTARSFAEEPAMKQAHELTRFPLRGAHATVSCSGCHTRSSSGQMQFVGRSTTCVGCHATDARAVAVPDHKAAGFTECAACHSINTWRNARFDHAQTAFPLVGAHLAATCEGCHADRVFKGKDTRCVSCHRDDYDKAVAPRHADGFPTTCADCHGNSAWKGATFDHQATRFPLSGAHRVTTCQGCHADGVYRGKAMDCAGCHRSDYDRTATPPHAAAGFPTTCATCHNTTAWPGAPFDHGTTRFALTGAHNAVACTACHGDQVYRGKTMECRSCHQSDFQATKNPPHASSAFTAPCTMCHTTTAWAGASFNHDVTRFPLQGAHRATACMGCHADGIFAGKPMTCASCHQARYDAARTPPHSGFPTTCESCHGTATWTGATFDHSTSDFPLTGAHRATSCAGCHGDGVFNGKATDCASCHRARYDATTNPPHAATGYSTACATCHTTTAWPGAVFNHSTTRFPLTGAHVPVPCLSCHADGVYRGKSMDCYSCHRTSYDATRTPPHGASAIGTACTQCHTTSTWAGGTYDHAVTSFPLTGAHRASSCNGCHADGVYKGKSTTCLSCHQTDYTATTQPPHGSSGIGTVCSSCHTTTAWLPGTFNHSATTFPLTGAHTAATCLSCHGDGVYRGKSTACASCHQADYNQTTNPNHTSAQFPTACASCHTTATWLGATFDHDSRYFPIYSGKHRGKWSTCATCHTSPTDYKVFTCLTCHEHAKTKMDQEHQGRSGYVYQSTACYACHPRGNTP